MDNIESVIYCKNCIKLLDEEGFFNEVENPFMDSDKLYDEFLKHSTNNLKKLETPEITSEQFDESVKSVRLTVIGETFNDLIEDGIIEASGVDKDGGLLYSINEEVKVAFEKKLKKKRPKT
jgi:hypothetical protein